MRSCKGSSEGSGSKRGLVSGAFLSYFIKCFLGFDGFSWSTIGMEWSLVTISISFGVFVQCVVLVDSISQLSSKEF